MVQDARIGSWIIGEVYVGSILDFRYSRYRKARAANRGKVRLEVMSAGDRGRPRMDGSWTAPWFVIRNEQAAADFVHALEILCGAATRQTDCGSKTTAAAFLSANKDVVAIMQKLAGVANER